MKLIIQNKKIVAIVTIFYDGPELNILAPDNFDESQIEYYRYDEETGTVVLNDHGVLETQTQERLNNFAKTKGYDNISVACTYSNSSNSIYKLEGDYCISARDNTWSSFYNILNSEITINSFSDIEPLLPVLEWPEEVTETEEDVVEEQNEANTEIVIESSDESANTPI